MTDTITRDQQVYDTMKKVHDLLQNGGPAAVAETDELIKSVGIEANLHTGQPVEWFTPTTAGEWMLGQIRTTIKHQAWYSMNSQLNGIHEWLKTPYVPGAKQ